MRASPISFNDTCEPEVPGAQGGSTPPQMNPNQQQAINLALQLSSVSTSNVFCPSSEHILPEGMLGVGAIARFGQEDGDRSRIKGSNMTECVPVPSSEHVAEIVGRQGCKIKSLRAKTNTYIKTPVRGDEPVFVVTGRKEDVVNAKKEIMSAAEHFSSIRATRKTNSNSAGSGLQNPNQPGQITQKVEVPYKVVGLVVGPKGATIKRIQQGTNTYIVTPSREKDPIFEVTGLPENVERARHEIESHISSRTGSNFSTMNDDFHTNGYDIMDYPAKRDIFNDLGAFNNGSNSFSSRLASHDARNFGNHFFTSSSESPHNPHLNTLTNLIDNLDRWNISSKPAASVVNQLWGTEFSPAAELSQEQVEPSKKVSNCSDSKAVGGAITSGAAAAAPNGSNVSGFAGSSESESNGSCSRSSNSPVTQYVYPAQQRVSKEYCQSCCTDRNQVNFVCVPCGHGGFCKRCSSNISQKGFCPICLKSVDTLIQLQTSNL